MPRRPRTYTYDTPPRKGDYGMTAGSSLAMFVIRLGTFSRYGHACVALNDPDPDGTIRIIEAMPEGARIRLAGLDEFRWSNIILADDQRDAIATRAEVTEGIPYDWPAILGFVAATVGYKLKLIGRRNAPDAKMICSELVVWSYLAASIDLGLGKAPGQVSPGDLAEYLVSH
jgi:hypothetical protein